jgi:hypothetical protein
MNTEQPSFPRSTEVFRRHYPGRTLIESKCSACGQIVDPMNTVDQSLEQSEPAFPDPLERINGVVAGKRASNAIDLEKVLHFSQQLYAHALTLQELIRNDGGVTYEVLRPRYDQQAAQQFEIFYQSAFTR